MSVQTNSQSTRHWCWWSGNQRDSSPTGGSTVERENYV